MPPRSHSSRGQCSNNLQYNIWNIKGVRSTQMPYHIDPQILSTHLENNLGIHTAYFSCWSQPVPHHNKTDVDISHKVDLYFAWMGEAVSAGVFSLLAAYVIESNGTHACINQGTSRHMHMRQPRYVNSDYCFTRWRGDEVVCQDMNHFPFLVQHSTTAFEYTMTTTSFRTQCDNCTNKRATWNPRSLVSDCTHFKAHCKHIFVHRLELHLWPADIPNTWCLPQFPGRVRKVLPGLSTTKTWVDVLGNETYMQNIMGFGRDVE